MADNIHRSKIGNLEWGLVIGALILVDIIQILLDFVAIGIAVNRGIDVIVGLALPFYLHIRGEKMGDPKRLFGFLATLGLEFVPLVDGLPLWSADGFYNLALAKMRNKEVAKQEKEQEKIEKQKKIEIQQDRKVRLQQVRQQQQEQREEQRENQRVETQAETEQNAVGNDEQDLYDRAA